MLKFFSYEIVFVNYFMGTCVCMVVAKFTAHSATGKAGIYAAVGGSVGGVFLLVAFVVMVIVIMKRRSVQY